MSYLIRVPFTIILYMSARKNATNYESRVMSLKLFSFFCVCLAFSQARVVRSNHPWYKDMISSGAVISADNICGIGISQLEQCTATAAAGR